MPLLIAALVALIAAAVIGWFRFASPTALMQRAVARDDWDGARRVAERVLAGGLPTAGGDARRVQAAYIAGTALVVEGRPAEARRALEACLTADPHGPLAGSAARQLAAAERIGGDLDQARARLDATVGDGDGDVYLGLHRAALELAAGDPPAAAVAASASVTSLRRLLGQPMPAPQRAAWEADLAQATATLVQCLLAAGDVTGATAVSSSLDAPASKPYVQGQVAEVRARLALAQDDRITAVREAQAARARYEQVRAPLDVVRADLLRAAIERDAGAVDDAEARLRAAGALGYLYEVTEVRRALG